MSLSVLEEYIETGNYQDLDLLLSREPELIKESTSQQISPLLLACFYNKPKVVQTLLKYVSSLTIHEACAVGLIRHVQLMIEHKEDVIGEISTQGFTPLGIASHFGKEDIVRLLLTHNADPNIGSQNGYNVYPLHSALSNNHSEIAKMLIEAGSEVNILQHGNISPLHLAAQHGNIDLIILLLENGANVHTITTTGNSASDVAASKGFLEIAEILKIN